MKTDRIVQALKEPASILGTFITLKAIATIYSFAVNAPWYLSQVRLAELIVLAIVSFYIIKGRVIVLWAMGIYLVIHVFALFLAILVIPIDQYIVKIITIILSLYFVFGGIVLIQSARAKTARK
jgi:hypothetical protein